MGQYFNLNNILDNETQLMVASMYLDNERQQVISEYFLGHKSGEFFFIFFAGIFGRRVYRSYLYVFMQDLQNLIVDIDSI